MLFRSIEMIVWVAVGGRGTLIGAVLGAIGVNWARSFLTTAYPDLWLYALGSLFIGVVLFFPGGLVGMLRGAGGASAVLRGLGLRAMTLGKESV